MNKDLSACTAAAEGASGPPKSGHQAGLDRALTIACVAHSGQVDKGGAPYILHPIRVMLAVSGEDEQIAAALHDVVEDCPEWSLGRLRTEGFSEAAVAAVDALTRRPGETYTGFILRAAENPIALRVKMADLKDNMDMGRIPNPTGRDQSRLQRYHAAYSLLFTALWSATARSPHSLSAEAHGL